MTANLKKPILATLISGLGMWIVAGIWHNLIMANLYDHVHATHDGLAMAGAHNTSIAYVIKNSLIAPLLP